MDCETSTATLGAFAVAAISALAGGLIGHHLTLARERTTRHGELADALHEAWFSERKRLTPLRGGPDALMLRRYARTLWWWRRARFLEHLKAYEKAKQQCGENELGEPFYEAPGEVEHCIDALLKFTER